MKKAGWLHPAFFAEVARFDRARLRASLVMARVKGFANEKKTGAFPEKKKRPVLASYAFILFFMRFCQSSKRTATTSGYNADQPRNG